MKTLSILIKPVSGRCNMGCTYCFYQEECAGREKQSSALMAPDTMESLVSDVCRSVDGRIQFAFQGGEPTLAGLDFYRSFVHCVERHVRPGTRVDYTIQTNGLLVNRDWADFLREHAFLVGISLDGTHRLHDTYRLDVSGRGTHQRVLRSVELLTRLGVDVNLLCVVTGAAARAPAHVYRALTETGCGYLQFIPCLDPLGSERGGQSYSLSPEDYGGFLCSVFDLWRLDWERGHYISVRLFDDYVHLLTGKPSGTCATCGACGGYLTVESDGSVYPCDFVALDEWCLGNIRTGTVDQLLASEKYRKFVQNAHILPPECGTCLYASLCRGGCQRDRISWADGIHNYYCQAFRKFFDHAYSRLARMAQLEHLMSMGSSALS